MSKLAKKFATIATIITVVAMVVGPVAPAQAQTTAELQAQVAALQAQLTALLAQLNATTGGTTGTTGTLPSGCSFDRNLKQGMSGADVKCLQQVLNSDADTRVAVSGVGSAGNETTYFGSLTTAAVNKYQVKQGIVAVGTGFVGPLTRAKLNAGTTGGATGTTLPAGCTTNSGYSPTTGQPCGSGTAVVIPTTGVVTASLASDNSASASIVTDSTAGDGAQSLIPMLKVNLSNGTASPITVTSMKFTRSGISDDSDISQAYLYDGDTMLADYSSFSLTVLTFNSASLITIPANTVKTITLKVDLADTTDAGGKTIRFGINAASDIVSNASSIGGVFPLTGNYMTTAQTSSLGKLTVAVQATNPAAPDPGAGVEVMKFTLAAADQNIQVKKLVFTDVGTVAYTDLTNFTLFDAATPIGSVVASANSDKTVVMDLSASPILIEKGNTKNMTLKADIVGGTSRDYTFKFQNMYDIVAYDTQYGIYVKPNQSDTWTILSGAKGTINNGTVTATRATDSPSGNISASSTNQVLAKFVLKASGEDVKISDLTLKIYGSIGVVGMYQTSVYYNGAQVGQTTTTMDTQATAGATEGVIFSFGNTLILPAGSEKVLEIRSDVKNASGGSIAAGSTLTAQVSSFTATGKTSGASVTIGSVTGYQLTVSAGTLVVTENQAVPDWSSSTPTGVAGATNALIGSFILTAGSGEGASVTALTAQIIGTANTEYQNVRIYKGTLASGVQLGAALNNGGTPTVATDYTVYPSPYLSLNAGEQVVLNVYADILTGASTATIKNVKMGVVYGTGKVTNTSVNSSGTVTGQNLVVSSGGYVGVFADTNTPSAGLVVMGTTGVEFAKFKLSASSSPEAMTISGLVATTTLNAGTALAPTSSVSSITLTSALNPSWSVILPSLSSAGVADFTGLMTANPLVIPAGEEDVITLKANIGVYGAADSNSYIVFGLATTTYRGESGSPTTIAPAYRVAGTAQYIYKSKPTVTLIAQPTAGSTFSDGTQTLIKFRVAADSKGAIDLNRVNIKVAINDIATSTSNLYLSGISLYQIGNSTVLNSAVSINATSSTSYIDYSASSTVSASKFGGALTGDPLSKTGNILLSNTDGTALKQIGAGNYVDFEVKATVTGSAQYDTMTFSLDNLGSSSTDTNAIKWGDTITNVIPATYVTGLPTDTWSYTR
ncbi:MAG: peptidoglycan-binding domain-containing protein [Candidatus Pacebacteria bacterium]|nr:peptidoglycan-binding domain-containing protein [Candidatus Paceibacterota bacterium]